MSRSGIKHDGQAINHRLNRNIAKPRFLSMIEWDHEAQQELLILGQDHDACVYGDICDFFKPELLPTINMLKKSPEVVLQVLVGCFRVCVIFESPNKGKALPWYSTM